MTGVRNKFLLSVLDCIEKKESKLLVWGVVDGLFKLDELEDLIEPLLDSAYDSGLEEFSNSKGVISELLKLKWLVEIECQNSDVGYRSRMSETVRLLQRLRQLFPKHSKHANGWQEAPNLVADFRFQRRLRQYPRRDIPKGVVLERLTHVTKKPSILKAAKAVIDPNDEDVQLSGFQVRATERILHAIESDEALATIICAGTGSGKTLAFYLPALSSIASHHQGGNNYAWVKTVALYPRTELLKDQLREVLKRAIDLSSSLKGISIRVGAFYGDVLKEAKYLPTSKSWKKEGDDYICPSLKCIKCNGEMLWRHSDHIIAKERIECRHCQWEISGDVFPLTRDSLSDRPPDILFTTTEMLNQRLSDNRYNHLFGVGVRARKPPELVLLDEVHTYEGRHGAQVAYLMRRWAYLVERPLRFVGLSATLREASSFFTSLTGARQSLVAEISPHPDEIESEGAEYMIALRGDPVSRAALLSTTIQTTMLLERCLDPKTSALKDSISKGAFGQRTFVFTDDLDVTNRLYFGLLSAEGRKSDGAVDMRNAPTGGLAVLRKSGASSSKYRGGQDWRMCEELGRNLSDRLDIGRVSSQDRGVNESADVIVATASLEVGFDDPSVGVVIQHKAPKGMAGFLQRKGRGGRTRGMRPWTAVVLSDYGRDRTAYQCYDMLFDPELPARTLPLSNRYITKMQAVFATIDYLGLRLQDAYKGSVWSDLTGPSNEKGKKWQINDDRKKWLVKEIGSILDSHNGEKKLHYYLMKSLKISSEDATSMLWEYPRPIMTMVLPTALRRLSSGWFANGETGMDIKIINNPLPEFVPGTLFADLNLAEVRIELPKSNYKDQQAMSVFSALREFAPGRVSRRYGIQFRTERYWTAPPTGAMTASTSVQLDIKDFGTYATLGNFSYWDNNTAVNVLVFRPVSFAPTIPDTNITDTSQGRLKWVSQFVPLGQPIWLQPPNGLSWGRLINRLGFFTHSKHAPVEVRRFALGSNAEIGIGRGEKTTLDINFCHEENPVGLGASYAADGVVFQLMIPDDLHKGNENSNQKWRALRTTRYFDASWRGESLSLVVSPFMRKWLAEVFLSGVTFEAIKTNTDLQSAAMSILSNNASISLNEVLEVLFQSKVTDVDDDEFTSQDKLRTDLEELLMRPEILEELMVLGDFLWVPITAEWEPWLRKTYQCTLGSSILKTIGDLCPSINPDDLTIDLERGPKENQQFAELNSAHVEIWITEKSPGGNGLIETFMQSYAEDPRRFFSMVRATLEMGEFELIDHQLVKLLNTLGDESSEIYKAVSNVRASTKHEELTKNTHILKTVLLRSGFSPFHGFLVSLGSRILRPGAGVGSDNFLSHSINEWKSEEKRLGLEIDLRVICYWLAQNESMDAIIPELNIPPGTDRTSWRMSAIYGLLWGRGREIRQASLQVRNQFAELPPVERLLVIDTIIDDRVKVSVENNDWLNIASDLLSQGKLVTLICDEMKRELLGASLHMLITNPVETGYLRAYARLQGVRQSDDLLEVDIEVTEVPQ